MQFPASISDLLERIARETARMSWPGKMNNLLMVSTKKKLEEEYFSSLFPIKDIWYKANQVADNYDEWHKARIEEMDDVISRYNKVLTNNSKAISSKLLNTFMHQLMKYDNFDHYGMSYTFHLIEGYFKHFTR